MKRIYFIAPSIDSTSSIVDELHEIGITDEDIHVVGKDHAQLQEAHIHEAGLLETTDVTHSMHVGARYGAILGAIAGVIAAFVLPIGWLGKLLVVAGLAAFGTAFGAWASSLVGISIPEPGVEKYQQAVEQGQLLMLVDVSDDQEKEIRNAIRLHHPEARIGETRLN